MLKKVSEIYDELWHYTSFKGVHGIISTGSVWATEANYLNDATEIKHFFDVRMFELARPVIHDFAQEKASNPAVGSQMKAAGGVEKVVIEAVDALVSRFRSATLDVNDSYIFSLTAPGDDYVRFGELLSQWRGYGSDGGFALVFDPAGIEKLVQEEKCSYSYQYMACGDVFYYGLTSLVQPSTEEILIFEKQISDGIARQVRRQPAINEGDFFNAITSLSCFYKHWGFHEEREVRIVAIPSLPEVANAARRDGEDLPVKGSKAFLRLCRT